MKYLKGTDWIQIKEPGVPPRYGKNINGRWVYIFWYFWSGKLRYAVGEGFTFDKTIGERGTFNEAAKLAERGK